MWPSGTPDVVVRTLKISLDRLLFFFFEHNCTQAVYNFQICTCTCKHVQKPDYTSLDGEATQYSLANSVVTY